MEQSNSNYCNHTCREYARGYFFDDYVAAVASVSFDRRRHLSGSSIPLKEEEQILSGLERVLSMR